MNKLCPVCHCNLPDPVPNYCNQCAWDIKNDITLNLSIHPISEATVVEYKKRLEISRRNWQAIQKDNNDSVLQDDQKDKHNNEKETEATDNKSDTPPLLERDEFETVDEYERRINGLPPFKVGTVSFGRYDIEQGILPVENLNIYDWASQLKPTYEMFFLEVNREIAQSLKSGGVQEIELFVKTQATLTKLTVSRIYIYWNNEEYCITYTNETFMDTKMNLMWAAKDHGTDINWQDAKTYCDNYRGGGYKDWRMPTQGELAGLYASGNYRNIIADESWVWASETRGPESAFFRFGSGDRGWVRQSYIGMRALPVRSGK